MEDVTLGIDFGTTTTEVAFRLPDKPPIPLAIGRDGVSHYIPSVVAFVPSPDGSPKMLVGEEADQAGGAATVIRSVKRCLGCDGNACNRDRQETPLWCTGEGTIQVPGMEALRPEHVVFWIVKEALRRAKEAALRWYNPKKHVLGGDGANFGCGSTFSLLQRDLILREAGHRLGFDHATWRNVVEEPIAAGMSYAKASGVAPGKVLIYDFGGGTFDTAILDIDQDTGRITVLAADGVRWLGGDDIDRLVFQHFLDQIAGENNLGMDDVKERLHPADRHQLQRLAVLAKESLSDNPGFSDTLFSDTLGMVLLDLSREQLEHLILESKVNGRNMIERSLDCVLSTYRAAAMFDRRCESRLVDFRKVWNTTLEGMAKDIDHVILVGGVTRMPLIRQRIIGLFGHHRMIDQDVIDPVDRVAFGAAYPVEAEHFNLLHPPYHIELVVSGDRDATERVLSLHEAFDKLDYFSRWLSNSRCVYQSDPCVVKGNYSHARLRFSGEGIQDVGVSLGCCGGDVFHLTVDLPGHVQLYRNGRPRGEVRPVPIRHPVQEEIVVSDRRRAQRDEDDMRKRASQYGWMDEN